MDIQQPNSSPSTQSPKNILPVIVLFAGIFLGVLVGVGFVARQFGSDEDQTLETTIEQRVVEEEEQIILDQFPFDEENPDIELQIEAIEAELEGLELDLLEEELADDQLGL